MNNHLQHYGIILAGGNGTRFWPLSRKKTPKQMLNLTGKDLMINETIDRIATVLPKDNIFIITSAEQASELQKATAGRILPDHILAEPATRNTAACIGYAALEIIKRYGNGVMLITPSDHYIKDVSSLSQVFNNAIKVAESTDKLVTIGITPTFPSTGFGYIKHLYSNTSVKCVTEFKEKPDAATAQKYIESGEYIWNSGMFIWKADVILSKFQKYAPDIYTALEKISKAHGHKEELSVLNEIYPCIRKVSIDYAIMEPAALQGDVLTIPGDFGWSDIGNWDMMSVLHDADEDGNVTNGDVLSIDSTNNVIFSSTKLVTVVGVSNLVIVETPDAIMVCDKTKSQDVRLIVDKLIASGRTDLI